MEIFCNKHKTTKMTLEKCMLREEFYAECEICKEEAKEVLHAMAPFVDTLEAATDSEFSAPGTTINDRIALHKAYSKLKNEND